MSILPSLDNTHPTAFFDLMLLLHKKSKFSYVKKFQQVILRFIYDVCFS